MKGAQLVLKALVDNALQAAADHPGAFMVEFGCDPSEIILPMVPAGGGIKDMIVAAP